MPAVRIPLRVLDHQERAVRHQRFHRAECFRQLRSAVRRIEHDGVVLDAVGSTGSHVFELRADNSIAIHDVAALQVLGDQTHRAWIPLDERHMRGAAAQGFDANRASAGVAVDHARAGDPWGEDVEHRLAKLVRRRSEPFPTWRLEDPAFQPACDDAHARLSDADQAEALFPAVTDERRECRRLRRVVEGDDCFAARVLHQLMVAQQIADAKGRHTGLARAEKISRTAKLQIPFGNLEAVGRLGQRLEPIAALIGQRRLIQQHAVRLVRSAPDAPAQLMELREAESLRVLDQHHRRVRHVHADLDHRRRHEHVVSPRANAPITRSFSSCFMPAVQQRDTIRGEDVVREVVGHFGRRP